jgi:hypothetical protein
LILPSWLRGPREELPVIVYARLMASAGSMPTTTPLAICALSRLEVDCRIMKEGMLIGRSPPSPPSKGSPGAIRPISEITAPAAEALACLEP